MSNVPGITTQLPNFQQHDMVDQLNSPDPDGHPDINKAENCVAASSASCLEYETGRRYYPGELHDIVYGYRYLGGMAEVSYVSYARSQGVLIQPYNATAGGVAGQEQLVGAIIAHVQSGHPVIFTMPSEWGAPPPPDPAHPSGWTHVGAFYGVGPSAMLAMNPWGGFAQLGSISWWLERILFGQVWLVSKIGGGGPTPTPGGFPVLSIQQAANFFIQQPDGSWQVKQQCAQDLGLAANTPQKEMPSILGGVLEGWRNYASDTDLAGLAEFGLPRGNEHQAVDAKGNKIQAWWQDFERGRLACDPHHLLDQPPGVTSDMSWYRMHVNKPAPGEAPAPANPPTSNPADAQLLRAARTFAGSPDLTALLAAAKSDPA